MTEHLCDLPAHEQVRRIKGGEISAIELLKSSLERIDAVEGRQATTEPYIPNPADLEKVHAFITVTRERAHARAESIDRKIAAGEDPGPLAGVPLAVKDNFCVRDTPSTAGWCVSGREGQLLREGHSLHRWLEDPGKFHRSLQRYAGDKFRGRRRCCRWEGQSG